MYKLLLLDCKDTSISADHSPIYQTIRKADQRADATAIASETYVTNNYAFKRMYAHAQLAITQSDVMLLIRLEFVVRSSQVYELLLHRLW